MIKIYSVAVTLVLTFFIILTISLHKDIKLMHSAIQKLSQDKTYAEEKVVELTQANDFLKRINNVQLLALSTEIDVKLENIVEKLNKIPTNCPSLTLDKGELIKMQMLLK